MTTQDKLDSILSILKDHLGWEFERQLDKMAYTDYEDLMHNLKEVLEK